MAPKLRLLKVLVQPVFVIDDGEHLIEQTLDAIAVPAAAWPTYPVKEFAEAVAGLEAQLQSHGTIQEKQGQAAPSAD
jgi:hypothetical protein